jgi:sugar phosphate isomerase/epimerase
MKKTTILLGFALLFTAIMTDAFAQKGKLYSFPIGMQAYTYRASFPKDVAATLDTLKALGITELEGGAQKGTTPEEFRKMCEERGIKIPATGGGYEQLLKDPVGAAKTANILGSKYLMCAWIPHKVKGGFTFEEAKKAVDDFNTIGKALKENGVTFCYHIHGYEFQPYQDGTLFDYIVKNTNPEYVSFELDILWAYYGGADPVGLLKKYGKRFQLIHLKDLKKGVKGDLTGGTPLENDVTLGTGQIDIAGVIREAKKIGIKHYFIEDESPIWYQQVPKSIAYLKSL